MEAQAQESHSTPQRGGCLPRLLLLVLSTGFTLLVVFLVDRALGAFLPAPAQDTSQGISLVYPPNSEMHMRSAEFANSAYTNRLGFRGPDVPLRNPKAFRIVVLGDSFTFGWGVEYEQCWVAQLAERLRAKIPNVEVLNLGNSGTHSTYYAQLAEVAVPLLRPDVVLVAVLHGDAGGEYRAGVTPREKKPSFIARILPNLTAWAAYATGGQPPLPEEIGRPKPPMQVSEAQHIEAHKRLAADAIARFTPEERARYEALDPEVRKAFEDGLANPFVVNVGVTSPRFFEVFGQWDDVTRSFVPRLEKNFARIRDVARSVGATAIIASVPQGPYVNLAQNHNAARVGFETTSELLESLVPDGVTREAAKEADVPFVSATDEFREERDRTGLYYPIDTHFSPAGHALYAEILAPKLLETLEEEGVLP